MKTILKPLVAATVLAMSAMGGAAIAAPTQLYFSQAAGFVNPLTDGDLDTGFFGGGDLTMIGLELVGDYPAGTFAGMQWDGSSTGSDSSSLEIFSFTSGTSASRGSVALGDVDANNEWNAGEYWIIDRLLQTNNVITGGPFPDPLWIVDTSANLRIFDDVVGGNLVKSDLGSETRLRFWETLNADSAANCPNPNPLATPCDDIYTVTDLDFADLNWTRLYGGVKYKFTLSFDLFPGVGTLVCPSLDPRCVDAINPPAGQIRVYTPEISPGTSEIFVVAAWNVQRVPEPATLGLLGIGLVGLGLIGRRRKQQEA